MSEASKISKLKNRLDRVTENWISDDDVTKWSPASGAKETVEARYGAAARAAGFTIVVDEESSGRIDNTKTPARWKLLDKPSSSSSTEILFDLVRGDHKIEASCYMYTDGENPVDSGDVYDHLFQGKPIGFTISDGGIRPLNLTAYLSALSVLRS